MQSIAIAHRSPHGELVEADFERIAARLAQDHGMTRAHATAVFEATLAFLRMSVNFPHQQFVPSTEVDKGWHTFLLYSRAYQAFSRALGVDLIHHEPSDGDQRPGRGGYTRTIRFMREHGVPYNESLWPEPEASDGTADPCSCTGCTSW